MAKPVQFKLKGGGVLTPAKMNISGSGSSWRRAVDYNALYPVTVLYAGSFGGDVVWEFSNGSKILLEEYGDNIRLTVYNQIGQVVQPYNHEIFTCSDGEYVYLELYDDKSIRFYTKIANDSVSNFKTILPSVPTQQVESTALHLHHIVPKESGGTYVQSTSQPTGYTSVYNAFVDAMAPTFPGETSTETDPDNPSGGYIAGDYDDSSDPINMPTAPQGSINLSMYHIYAPSLLQMSNFARWLWNENGFDLTQLKKIFQNPIETILSLAQYPFRTSAFSETTENIVIGAIDSEQPAYEVISQFIDIDCGNLKITPFYGNALDYSPFTRISIVLPFVGAVDLDVDEVMGKELSVIYRVDLLTGTFNVYISVGEYNSNAAQKSVFYQFSGNMASQVPITQGSYIEIAKTLVSVAGGLFSGAAAIKGASSLSGAISGVAAAANGIASGKSTVHHTGSLSSAAGFLGCRKPYIIKHIPRQSLPKEYAKLAGFPTNVYDKLSTFSGFTVVSEIHLESIRCTKNEREAIDSLLRSGVIINANSNRTELTGLTLFVNGSENNTIYKSLTQVSNTTGYFRRNEDVETLILDISTESETFDYLYLSETNRYYFVRSRELYRDGLVRLTCEVDVLESHAAEILALNAIVARNEKRFNLYINDTFFQTYQNPIVVTKEFPSGLTGEGYVLITAGGTMAV